LIADPEHLDRPLIDPAVGEVFVPLLPSYYKTGFMGIIGLSEKGREKEWTQAVKTALRDATFDISDDRLIIAKRRLRRILAITFASPAGVVHDLGSALINGRRWMDHHESEMTLDKITRKDIIECAEFMYRKGPAPYSAAWMLPA
jgi:hypothetical protein